MNNNQLQGLLASLAAVLVGWLTNHHLFSSQDANTLVAGFGIAAAFIYNHWLHGRPDKPAALPKAPAVAAAAALMLLCCTLSGCGSTANLDTTGPYHGNGVLAASDITVESAVNTIDAFLQYEKANRAALPLSVTKAADVLRQQVPPAFAAYQTAHNAYLNAPTAANQTALTTAVNALTSLAAGVAEYYTAPAATSSTSTTK